MVLLEFGIVVICYTVIEKEREMNDHTILDLKLRFPDKFVDKGDDFLHEEHITEYLNPENDIERMIKELFERNPKAKIVKITFSPSFAEDDKGATITIHGKL
jgi:hypothetical protein